MPSDSIVTFSILSFSYFDSLPSLRPLLDVNYLPLTDMRIARTFAFSNLGQALYLTSPAEVQRITYSQETCDNLQVSKAPLSASGTLGYICVHYNQHILVFIADVYLMHYNTINIHVLIV